MAKYCYKVMLFGLKNMSTTYQRLTNKVFSKHIGNLMEICIDDMLVKTKQEDSLLSDLEAIFSCLLEPVKVCFHCRGWKVTGFYAHIGESKRTSISVEQSWR